MVDSNELRKRYNTYYSSVDEKKRIPSSVFRNISNIEKELYRLDGTRLYGKKILDIGSGLGDYCEVFRIKGNKVIGIDYSDEAINKAQKRFPLCTFLHMDGFNPIFDESFDIIFCKGFSGANTHDIDFVANWTNKYVKYLNPGGYFIFAYSSTFSGTENKDETANWSEDELFNYIEKVNLHFRTIKIFYFLGILSKTKKWLLKHLLGRPSKEYYYIFFKKESPHEVGIFTKRSLNPIHPRLKGIRETLTKLGYTPKIITPINDRPLLSRINWISFWFFHWHNIIQLRKLTQQYAIVFILDLKYLPLAKYAKKSSKKRLVIYETIDNNVHYHAEYLAKKYKFLSPLKKFLIRKYSAKEKRMADKYCDAVIVNSEALKNYFEGKAHVLFYFSPFEKSPLKNIPSKPPALIYFGFFSREKGSLEMLAFQKQYNLPLYIFGKTDAKVNLNANDNIFFRPTLDPDDLLNEIYMLLQKHFFLGLSLIKPVNFSYATQEANKDIDYLSLGIPIVGNRRGPTSEKIEAGCGVYYDDSLTIREILENSEKRKELRSQCIQYYENHFHSTLFLKKMNDILESLKKYD